MVSWTEAQIPSQIGRLAVVTGTEGLGQETALALARAGAEVILGGLSEAKGDEAVRRIRQEVPRAEIRFELLDLASLKSVALFAGRLSGENRQVDLVVNNAGIFALPTRRLSEDGFEMQFATNYLGHFALTAQLLPLLQRSGEARVVHVSSHMHKHGRIQFEDLQGERRYRPWLAYAHSKLALLMFSFELQRRSDAHGWRLKSIAVHPGYARTNLIPNGLGAKALVSRLSGSVGRMLSQPAAQGAWSSLFAATSAEALSGGYYGPCGFLEFTGPPAAGTVGRRALDKDVARRLWEVSEELIGLRWPAN
jgi:NAD(P)-dependent dehydrogenase (short-subunit alcohol dehydrogenase family)